MTSIPPGATFNGRHGSIACYSGTLVKMRKWQLKTDTNFIDAGTDASIKVNDQIVPTIARRFTPENYEWDAQVEGFLTRGADEANLSPTANPMLQMMKIAGIAIVRHNVGDTKTYELLNDTEFQALNEMSDEDGTVSNQVLAIFSLDDDHWYQGLVFVQTFEIIAEFPKSVLASITLKGTGTLEYHIDLS